LLGQEGIIYSVDRDKAALKEQEQRLKRSFSQVILHPVLADFTRPIDLPELDGIVMANALHFVPRNQQVRVVHQVRGYLRPGGKLIMVEYNTDQGNLWVPYPISYARWPEIAASAGFQNTRLLETAPSSFLRGFYSALNW
jgi:SAM-dependent methyltransferase